MVRQTQNPRPGSRPHALVNLPVGHSLVFEAPQGRSYAFMAQIQTDIQRNGLKGKMEQALLIAVHPATREVFDIVRVTRVEP